MTEDEMRWLNGMSDLDTSLSKLWETVKDREIWHAAAYGVTELVKTGGYLLCPDLLLWSLLLPNLCHFGHYRKNNYKKIHPSTPLLLGWTNIFSPVYGCP